MTDWERITAIGNGEESNPRVRYSSGNCAFAICHPAWRDNGEVNSRVSSLLEFRKFQLGEVLQKHAYTSLELGAAIDWALQHRDVETWLRGEML